MPPAPPKTRTQRLRGRDYYHGMITRADVSELLNRNGEYLLRKTEQNGEVRLALSVYWQISIKHFLVHEQAENVYFEEDGHHEREIEALVRWHEKNRCPVTKQSGVILRQAIPREEWVLTHESITLQRKIGAGQFGEVFSGELRLPNGAPIDVAIKTLKDEGTVNQKSFLAEARLMRQLRHDNVIRIFGVAVYERPLMIVMELCSGGALITHLRTQMSTEDQKCRWMLEAARGLEYISNKGLIHRDIAARNALLSGPKLTLKIADFGLTLKATEGNKQQTGRMPVKWLARETLENGVYNWQTDVWSYAVLCWEIFADGTEPYPRMTNAQARSQIMLNDYRMEMPRGTPRHLSALIQRCWATNPDQRPTFKQIVKELMNTRA